MILHLLWFLLQSSWVMLLVAAGLGLLNGTCSALLIATVNQALTNQQSDPLLRAFLGLLGLNLVTGFLAQLFLDILAQNSLYKLRIRLSGLILACPLQQLEALGPSKLLATLTDDIQSIAATVFSLPFLCINLALVGGCLIYLGWLSWIVLLVACGCLAVAIVTIQTLIGQVVRRFKQVRELQDGLFKHYRAITEGIKELKLHAPRREMFLQQELETTASQLRRIRLQTGRLTAATSGMGELFFFVLLGVIIFGLPSVMTIPGSVLSAYVVTLTYLSRPLQGIMQSLPLFSQGSVALQKIETLGLTLGNQGESLSLPGSSSHFDRIQLDQIVHRYRREGEEDPFKLGAVSFAIKPGELLFIVGGNGSGKSTLAKLLTGLYSPESGRILWDDQPVTEANREAYRQLFSTVFADFYLFDRILGISANGLDQQAQQYLQQLHLSEKVKVQQGVLSTLDLSQGQRKRLALLSAYLEDRPIYLFDEWASDQDPVFREIFYTQLLPELKRRGKAVIVISHDDRYFYLADRLIRLEYGQVVS